MGVDRWPRRLRENNQEGIEPEGKGVKEGVKSALDSCSLTITEFGFRPLLQTHVRGRPERRPLVGCR
jgi:hypothetical protein